MRWLYWVGVVEALLLGRLLVLLWRDLRARRVARKEEQTLTVIVSNTAVPLVRFPAGSVGPSQGGGLAITFPCPSEPGESDDLELTFGTELLIATRAWLLHKYQCRDGTGELRLGPVGVTAKHATLWPPRHRMEARCDLHAHDAPNRSCQCGVWALPAETAEIPVRHADFVGTVALWGRVIEFENGYRAQYAYPLALTAISSDGVRLASEVADLYGVPVTRP